MGFISNQEICFAGTIKLESEFGPDGKVTASSLDTLDAIILTPETNPSKAAVGVMFIRRGFNGYFNSLDGQLG